MGWENMELAQVEEGHDVAQLAQVEEGHDVAERMHWDICCCLKRAELQEQGLWLTVLVQPQFLDPVP